jgi:hypothetical protein
VDALIHGDAVMNGLIEIDRSLAKCLAGPVELVVFFFRDHYITSVYAGDAAYAVVVVVHVKTTVLDLISGKIVMDRREDLAVHLLEQVDDEEAGLVDEKTVLDGLALEFFALALLEFTTVLVEAHLIESVCNEFRGHVVHIYKRHLFTSECCLKKIGRGGAVHAPNRRKFFNKKKAPRGLILGGLRLDG